VISEARNLLASAYSDVAPPVLLLLFDRERIKVPMAFQPITGSASSPGSGVFPTLVFVQGNDQRMMNLDHTPFTVGRKVDKDLVVADPRVPATML